MLITFFSKMIYNINLKDTFEFLLLNYVTISFKHFPIKLKIVYDFCFSDRIAWHGRALLSSNSNTTLIQNCPVVKLMVHKYISI